MRTPRTSLPLGPIPPHVSSKQPEPQVPENTGETASICRAGRFFNASNRVDPQKRRVEQGCLGEVETTAVKSNVIGMSEQQFLHSPEIGSSGFPLPRWTLQHDGWVPSIRGISEHTYP